MASSGNTNICPAVISSEETPNEMTEEEFQKTLITWFEDHGLLSELRAHLRKQMIGILKDTKIGQSTTKTNTKLSPKAHVTNLLIAEFLLKNRYHYSLSVFSTEVPFFMNLLPDVTKIVQNTNYENTANCKYFNHQNICDILETLGYLSESYEFKKLYDLYFQNNDLCLLNCMIYLLPRLTKLKMKNNENIEDTISLETWVKDIHNLLIHYELNSSYVVNLRNQIKLIFERELNKIKEDEEIKFKTKQIEINKDIVKREGEIKKLITEMESTYNRERKRMSEEHLKELKNVEKLKMQYKQYKNDYESKLEILHKKEDIINQRELELQEQLEILKSRTKVMQNVYESVMDENKKIIQYRQEIQFKDNNSEEIIRKLNTECLTLRKEMQTTKQIIENMKKTTYVDKELQTVPTTENSEHQLLKQMLERVQNENSALRILNSEQQRRLDEITNQNVELINDLENCQTTINILTRTNSQRGTITVPPIMPSAPFSRNYSLCNLNGGGENLGYVPSNSPPLFRHANHNFRNYSRRNVAKAAPNKESSTSSSPTEDILLEARQRLRRLERESESIDRHYRTFRERQSRENINIGTFSVNNIPECIRAQQSANREALFSTLRPTFHNRIAELPSTSSQNLRQPFFKFSTSNNNKESNVNKAGSSFMFNLSRHERKASEKSKEEYETVAEENRFSTGHSAASSRISQLQNLSLSSIEISSDSEDITNENNTKDQ